MNDRSLSDWHASLTTEQIAAGSDDEKLFAHVVFAECDQHPWTVIDIAMTLMACSVCGSELGGGCSGIRIGKPTRRCRDGASACRSY
jgi:hypothetical protein